MASLAERKQAREARPRPWLHSSRKPAASTRVVSDDASITSTAVSAPLDSTLLTESSLDSGFSKLCIDVEAKCVVSPLRIRLQGVKPCRIPRASTRPGPGSDVDFDSYAVRGVHLAGLRHGLLAWAGKTQYRSLIPRRPEMVGRVNPFYKAVDSYQPPALPEALFEQSVASEFADVNDPDRDITSGVPKKSCLKKRCSRGASKTKKSVHFAAASKSLIPRLKAMVLEVNPFHKAVDFNRPPSKLGAGLIAKKVRKIALVPTFYRDYQCLSYQCEHALVWDMYLQVFYPGLMLPSTCSELHCIQGSCFSPEEKRTGTMDHLSGLQSFGDWADLQYQGDGRYDYFDCLNDGESLNWYTEESGENECTDIVPTNYHPAQKDINTCWCVTREGPILKRHRAKRECAAYWAERGCYPVQEDSDEDTL